MRELKIALIEPFFTGSHRKWAEGFARYSRHQINIFGLSGRFWKWRMHGAAITLAKQIASSNGVYDLFIVSDFLDLALFKSLLPAKYKSVKFILYFHENQLTYPWSSTDPDVLLKRDNHYAFINYTSALVSDHMLFNSNFHKESFISHLPKFLKQFPDYNNLETIVEIEQKATTLSLALELPQKIKTTKKIPKSILWNHRWEYDKNPESFFNVLKKIKEKNIPFQLIVLGEKTNKKPDIFNWAEDYFREEIIQFGYAKSVSEYWKWLEKAHILPVTSKQDFFGISIVEAMHANVYPLLPNRLVYPEHIPPLSKEKHLYESDEELELKIINLLKNDFFEIDCARWVGKYDWTNSIKLYDDTIQSICD